MGYFGNLWTYKVVVTTAGVILPMNFILFQDSREDFTKYLLHKAVISFNRTEDHCLQLPLFPSSQDELKKGGHRVLCYWDPHLFPLPVFLALPSLSPGKHCPILGFRKPVCDSL